MAMQANKATQLGRSVAAAEQSKPQHAAAKWNALINDTLVPAPQRVVRVSVLLEQAGVAADKVLVRDHGSEEDVATGHDELIDLAHGNVFYVVDACDAPPIRECIKPAKLALFVDDRPEVTLNPNQTGKTIRELFGLREDVNLLRDHESPHDEPVGVTDSAPFERGPVFITRRQHEKLTIIVNGREKIVKKTQLSYLEVVRLAFDPIDENTIYTVTYKKGPDENPEGSMVDGDIVTVACGMIFNVTPTRKS
jgi:Multiubiquitin